MSENIEIHLRRAQDITDTDVVRLPQTLRYQFRDGKVRSYSQYAGTWREVLDVYREPADVYAQFTTGYVKNQLPDLDKLLDDALGRTDGFYVVLRLLVQEKSYGEYEDVFVPLSRFDLVEVQSEPAFQRTREDADRDRLAATASIRNSATSTTQGVTGGSPDRDEPALSGLGGGPECPDPSVSAAVAALGLVDGPLQKPALKTAAGTAKPPAAQPGVNEPRHPRGR